MRQRLKDLMEFGADIEFTVNGKDFVILAWVKEGIVIGPADIDEDAIFPDADSLMDGYIVDGKPLSEWMDEIVIRFSTF
ncbi:MAG: hypothetical protein IJ955_01655 [Oscillospiraceae bacterium]|nr:hypothetical protein [Oscillospiraceae bacterium]